jgi:hypothetical protein
VTSGKPRSSSSSKIGSKTQGLDVCRGVPRGMGYEGFDCTTKTKTMKQVGNGP